MITFSAAPLARPREVRGATPGRASSPLDPAAPRLSAGCARPLAAPLPPGPARLLAPPAHPPPHPAPPRTRIPAAKAQLPPGFSLRLLPGRVHRPPAPPSTVPAKSPPRAPGTRRRSPRRPEPPPRGPRGAPPPPPRCPSPHTACALHAAAASLPAPRLSAEGQAGGQGPDAAGCAVRAGNAVPRGVPERREPERGDLGGGGRRQYSPVPQSPS